MFDVINLCGGLCCSWSTTRDHTNVLLFYGSETLWSPPLQFRFTPLMWASREGHVPVVHLLLEHHADVNINSEEVGHSQTIHVFTIHCLIGTVHPRYLTWHTSPLTDSVLVSLRGSRGWQMSTHGPTCRHYYSLYHIVTLHCDRHVCQCLLMNIHPSHSYRVDTQPCI